MTRKIAWMILVLQVLHLKTFDGVRGCCSCLEETCHRPPREETERLQTRGERGEKTVYSRSQSAYQSHIFFSQHNTISACNQFQSGPREKARCLPGTWVINAHLALQGWIMTEHMASVWCVQSTYWFKCGDISVKQMHMHVNPCRWLYGHNTCSFQINLKFILL